MSREKVAEQSRIVGKGVARLDGMDKITGRSVYGVDVELPGMLIGKILRSPLPHARIRHIDTSKATRVPGVRSIITGADTPQITYGFLKFMDTRFADKLPLETDKVRFVGDEVAAVAAADEDAALEALSLIEVDYEELPAVFDPLEALAPGAPLVHDAVRDNTAAVVRKGAGDIDAAWRRAEVVLERSYSTHAVTPCCLEPHQAVANYDALAGSVTLYASTQMPFQLRGQLADALGLPEPRVRIIKTVMGGGFGSRMEMHAADPIAALLSLKSHRPVKIVYSRAEEFQATRFRHPFQFQCKIGLTRAGEMVALEARAVVDSGAYMSQAPGVTGVAGTNPFSLYRWPAFRFEGTIVYTNKPYAGAFRGYGNPQGTLALESLVDEAADALGMDRFELRRRNLHAPGDVSILGFRFDTCAQRECLEAVEAALEPKRPRAKWRGIGIAGAFGPGGGTRVFGDSDGCGATMKLENDGILQVLTGAQEIGQGGTTIVAQIAAETVGVPYSCVRVESSDTSVIPWDLGTHGSRNTFVAGNAIAGAGKLMRGKLLEAAAEILGVPADALDGREGTVWVRDEPDRAVTVAAIARACHYRRESSPLSVQFFYDPPTEMPGADGVGNKSAAYAFGFHGAEVEVDPETGEVRVLRMVAAHDVGRAINPKGAVGQIEGGIAQGLGFALTEQLFDPDGQTVLANFRDYKIPAAADMPAIESILIETDDPNGPYGAKGVAEPGLVPVAAAIANAVADAIGARVRDLPITPEKVLAAIEAAGKRAEPVEGRS